VVWKDVNITLVAFFSTNVAHSNDNVHAGALFQCHAAVATLFLFNWLKRGHRGD
jgi:hypothetical protein